ncbi:hypothetical protein AV530_006024 [Patagioenas fasciata monilis]|uniref:Uncharacterized protein n=1 Tax=Patagioenas fasciata monilis TaxID=372326 RepID=A0A1V4J7Z2_PATFA|nr:hypothetical protein AV530_006024 [Patagioenas fasciata monilis]
MGPGRARCGNEFPGWRGAAPVSHAGVKRENLTEAKSIVRSVITAGEILLYQFSVTRWVFANEESTELQYTSFSI